MLSDNSTSRSPSRRGGAESTSRSCRAVCQDIQELRWRNIATLDRSARVATEPGLTSPLWPRSEPNRHSQADSRTESRDAGRADAGFGLGDVESTFISHARIARGGSILGKALFARLYSMVLDLFGDVIAGSEIHLVGSLASEGRVRDDRVVLDDVLLRD